MKTGLESLDTGAPEITYSGNEGPKSPEQIQQMQMAQLEEEYDAYVDDMIEQGIQPMSMQQFLEQIAAEAQMSSNEEGIGSMMQDPREMAAFGGIMGADGRRAYVGGSYGGGYGQTGSGLGGYQGGGDPSTGGKAGGTGTGTDGKGGTGGDNNGNNNNQFEINNKKKLEEEAKKLAEEKAADAREKARLATIEEQKRLAEIKKAAAEAKAVADKKEAEEKEAAETKQTRNFFQRLVDKNKLSYLKSVEKRMYEDDKSLEDYEEDDFKKGLAGNYGKIQGAIKSAGEGTLSQSEFEKFMPGGIYSDKPEPTFPGGGGGGQQTQQPATPPATPPPGGGLPDIPTDFVDLSGTSSYTDPSFANQYFYGTPTITLANGGRANYAGGGITDLRQGYFLGKLVKSITKPFKKAFRGFKKIAKSPMGRMALLALGGYYAGGGSMLGGKAMFGGQGFGTSKLANLFTKAPTNKFLSSNAVGDNVTKNLIKKTVDPSGNFLTKFAKTAFKPENAFGTIMGTSALSGAYTAYLNNKRDDETMAEYNRRLEIERGNFENIPVQPIEFAANGGRMGFMNGGDDDDDDDDDIFFRGSARSDLAKAMSNPRMKRAMGGSTGMPPVTMMSEGQNIKSFSDDESSAMNPGPTMQSQMPMRPPMIDPRMMQMNPQMMASKMNPQMSGRMMAAMGGLMSMGGRMGYAEGGESELLDMGGLEKDYRNNGGFVPMGEYERKDDVPARLSKNEFVFTADAVRNAGGGDIDRGAEIMENMMENLENGGQVSQESQGLSGAREMFATQQRLGEVL